MDKSYNIKYINYTMSHHTTWRMRANAENHLRRHHTENTATPFHHRNLHKTTSAAPTSSAMHVASNQHFSPCSNLTTQTHCIYKLAVKLQVLLTSMF
jgi:hypothetical protein